MSSRIKIQNARKNNLRIQEVELPLRSLVAIGGPSGAGKTSLLLGTIYAEGAARYTEIKGGRLSLSAVKANAVEVSGLPFVLALDGRSKRRSWLPSIGSELGILSEISRLFSSLPGECPECFSLLSRYTVEDFLRFCQSSDADGEYIRLEVPLPQGFPRQTLIEKGFTRLNVAGEESRIEDSPQHELGAGTRLVYDVVKAKTGANSGAIRALLEIARQLGSRKVVAVLLDAKRNVLTERVYSDELYCGTCGVHVRPLSESDFNPHDGRTRCSRCLGSGIQHRFTSSLMLSGKSLPLLHGGILPWAVKRLRPAESAIEALFAGLSLKPMLRSGELSEEETEDILFGRKRERRIFLSLPRDNSLLPEGPEGGVSGMLRRIFRTTRSSSVRSAIERYVTEEECEACRGTRLSPDLLFRRFGEKSLHEIFHLSLTEFDQWSKKEFPIALSGLQSRFDLCHRLGVEYLPLSRAAITLSSGERERLRILRAISSELQGVLYLLDEPLSGLFVSDRKKVADVFTQLASSGNSVLAIENGSELRAKADWICDLGPGGGKTGGKIVYSGPAEHAHSATLELPGSSERSFRFLELRQVSKRNIVCEDFRFPLGGLSVLAGPSGSGKSTFLHEILVPALKEYLTAVTEPINTLIMDEEISGVFESLRRTATVGTRSNVASFLRVTPPLREFFGMLPESKISGEITSARFRGKNLDEALQLTVAEALDLFERIPKVARILKRPVAVGLSYLNLNQQTATLSDGERQRLNLLRNLPQVLFSGSGERYVIVCDEPARGLTGPEICELVRFLRSLTERGHTVICGEHELQFLLLADYIVELGPGGGPFGGKKIAEGNLGDIVANQNSAVGRLLFDVIQRGRG